MAHLHTLTLQDVIWINSTILGKSSPFDYATLEDAVFCQFGYGRSLDVLLQGAKLLKSMAGRKPFEEGNSETALVATAAFLRLNGLELNVEASHALEWVVAFQGDTLENYARPTGHVEHGLPNVRGAVVQELSRYKVAGALPL